MTLGTDVRTDEGLAPLVEPGPPLTREQVSRYSRHLLVPGMGIEAQRRLLNARVVVIGAGGLGSPILSYLAAAGVGHLTIVDDDVIDTTNLQRQVIHRSEGVGRRKVDSAADHVHGLNPDVGVEVRHTRITPENAEQLLVGHDLVLDGADNFPTRYAVSDAATALGIPVVWAAVLRFDAQISSFVPGRRGSVSLRDLFPLPPRPEDVPSCSEAGVLGALVGQVGSIMAGEAVKLICGFGEPLVGRLLLVDALAQRTREVPLRPAGVVLPRPPHEPTRDLVPLEEVSAEEVSALLAARGAAGGGGGDAPVLLDVREPAEHALGTVPGALTVPVGEVLTWEELVGQLPEGPVVVYCKTGPRARRAAAHLVRIGHPGVRVMTGGILAWIDRVDPSLPSY
ncbi:ThiF family adenylyltransferase [Ornithinimicrobium avium]|uniref:Adenylyltransferase/sulfurtransferase MoeZ n=1 Tax=Ornithinimicrobium avium TaxID=2283195 RepID=A0A345NNB5_9MICO|nr:ThiF family adenylyltransferase [Ornithinimicrobium avium]AXH96523.1 adenylyltransferase/sulfurtransferase MoeZ [Ornithinimicrobium avium]